MIRRPPRSPLFPYTPLFRSLFHAVVDARVHLRHQLLEVSLRRHDLLIHRIRLNTLQRPVILLDLLLGGLAPLLGCPLDLLRDALDVGEKLPACGIFFHPLAGPEERLVFVALAPDAAQFPCLLVNHAPSSGLGQQVARPAEQVFVHSGPRPRERVRELTHACRAALVDLKREQPVRLEARPAARQQRTRRVEPVPPTHSRVARLEAAHAGVHGVILGLAEIRRACPHGAAAPRPRRRPHVPPPPPPPPPRGSPRHPAAAPPRRRRPPLPRAHPPPQ